MTDALTQTQRAVDYLTPPSPPFWRWEDEAHALAWADERTIGFQGEVAAVVPRLAPHGLPPFSAIVLLLAACREGFLDAPSRRGQLYGYATSLGISPDAPKGLHVAGVVSSIVRTRALVALANVCEGLERIAKLPAELRATVDAKGVLSEAVFEGTERELSADAAAAVAEALGLMAVVPARRYEVDAEDAVHEFLSVLSVLAEGLGRIDAESLALRARTGLEQLPAPA